MTTLYEDWLMRVKGKSESGMTVFNLKDGGAVYRAVEHGRRSRLGWVAGAEGMLSSLKDLEIFRWLQQDVWKKYPPGNCICGSIY